MKVSVSSSETRPKSSQTATTTVLQRNTRRTSPVLDNLPSPQVHKSIFQSANGPADTDTDTTRQQCDISWQGPTSWGHTAEYCSSCIHVYDRFLVQQSPQSALIYLIYCLNSVHSSYKYINKCILFRIIAYYGKCVFQQLNERNFARWASVW